MLKLNVKRYGIALLLCLSVAFRAHAQSAVDGAIGGTIEDKTGAVIPSAKVDIVSNATNAEQIATTDSQGYFRAIHLQPGVYTVTVKATGFQTFQSHSVTVTIGLLTDLGAKLVTGDTTTTVEVSDVSPAINTTSPDYTGIISQTTLNDLPQNNYRWSAYALLTPGVVSDSSGYGLLSFRGASTLLNNITLDGVDDNQVFYSEERGRSRAGYVFPKSVIQEFQVNTSNYSTEYGRAAGGVVNSITKSGTNAFHGEAYFLDRDQQWGAITPGSTIPTTSGTTVVFKPKDWRKQWGAAVGGPIIKDKLFFFFAYDQYRHNFPAVSALTASNAVNFYLTPAQLPSTIGAGHACYTTGPTAPTTLEAAMCALAGQLNGIAPLAANSGLVTPTLYSAAVSAWFAQTTGANGLNSMLGIAPRKGDQTLLFPKIDWQINSRNHLTVELNRFRWNSPNGFQTGIGQVSYGTASLGNDLVKDTYLISKLDTVILPNLANEVRYQYSRDLNIDTPDKPITAYEQNNIMAPAGYTNPFPAPPNVNIATAFQFGTYATGMPRLGYPDERKWQLADTMNWTYKNHSIKFGIDFVHNDDLIQSLNYIYGAYTYSGSNYTPVVNYISDLLKPNNACFSSTNTAQQCYSSFQQGFGTFGFEFSTIDYAGFIQDDWKITPRVSLTAGLRYEYEQLPSPYANLVNPALPQTAKFAADRNNIGPRVGFAFDVFGTGKTVLRGGYGMFFGRVINSTIFNALTSTGNQTKNPSTNLPYAQLAYPYSPGQAGAPIFPQVLATVPAAGGGVGTPAAVYFDPHFQEPQIHQTDLTLQQDLGAGFVMSATYLGAFGRELPTFVDQNVPTPTTISYTVSDPSHFGPLPNGTVVTTKYFAKQPTGACASGRSATAGAVGCSYSSLTNIQSSVSSSYHALAFAVAHRMTHGFQFDANYTWSHALDYGENNQTFSVANAPLDPSNPNLDYGNSNQNVPNRLVVNAVYKAPSVFHGYLSYLMNGWEIAPDYQIQNGLPYTLNVSGTSTLDVSTTFASVNGSAGSSRLSSFERNSFKLPKTQVADVRISKRFDAKIAKLELFGESFNIANHRNITAVSTTGYARTGVAASGSTYVGTLAASNTYGTVSGANNSNFLYSPRQIQVGVRAQF